ncbi:Fc.00g082540.m01.CDS01 [Cosmosporella sp. VM-42]
MSEFLKFVRNQYTSLPVPEAPANIADATYVVTGANSGLGLECVKHLFRMGAGRVIMAVRSLEKGEAALATIRREANLSNVGEVWELDLTSFESVEAFAKRLSTLNRLDALIANAGVVMTQFQVVEGMELSLVVNVVSTMLLSLRALPQLQATGRNFGIHPRLVIVSSNTALESNMTRVIENLQGDVFDALSTKKGFKTFAQYPKTKLLEIYAVRQLAALLPLSDSGVIINAVSPGLCYSALDRNGAFPLRLMMAVMRKMLARTAEEGSRNILHAAFGPPDSHGSYYSECEVKDHVIPSWITDKTGQRTQKRVWEDLLKRLNDIGHGAEIVTPVARNGNKPS